mgnify:CR=1 FL=1
MEKRELSEKELREKKLSLAKGTKYLLDFMFYAGILVTVSLPLSLKYIGKYLEAVEEHYLPAVIIFAILGVLALLLVNELRKMFGTVLAENCFVPENVASLRRMGDLSFFIAAMSAVRCVVYLTIAMLVIILVFIIAGMNKVVTDIGTGLSRVQNIATPPNTLRLNKKTPCTITGSCANCLSPDCICNQIVITRRSGHVDRIKVFLVGENLGF